MDKKEIILYLYFDQHMKQTEVATAVNTSQQYVSEIVKADERFVAEYKARKDKNKAKRLVDQKEYHKNYKRPKKDEGTYEYLLKLQKQNSLDMSSFSNMSDYIFAKWNPSIYSSNGKGQLLIDKKIKVSVDVPRKIKLKR